MARRKNTDAADETTDVKDGGKITADIKRILKTEIEKLPQLLEQLTPDQRAKTILELLQYVAPKYDKVKYDDMNLGWDVGGTWL